MIPVTSGRGFFVDSHGIYHDEPGLIFHRGLRFVGRADDGRILWKVLVAEWTVQAAIGACLLHFCRSKGSSNVPATDSGTARDAADALRDRMNSK